MRIGVDMMGGQDPGAHGRGIGRYVEQFITRLVQADPRSEYVLYCFDRFPPPRWACGVPAAIRMVPTGRRPLREAVQELVDRNADRLDAYLVTCPFSDVEGYRLPARPVQGPRVAAILYDLIPMLVMPEAYLGDDLGRFADYHERTARLRDYDVLLAISDNTARDAAARLGIPGRRVVNISSASREGFFEPAAGAELPAALAAMGVRKPYVLSVSGEDPRKDIAVLVRAFGLLPPELRAAHQLVVMCAVTDEFARRLGGLAIRCGVGDRLVLTGAVPDERLRDAYQHCAAFAFTSHYEGFGLPILEAMLCGAPVVAADNSSQVEVVGDAGLFGRTGDDADLAEKLAQLLGDPRLAADLRRRGAERARAFTWDETVRRAREAWNRLPDVRRRRPLLAFFCPLPPHHIEHTPDALALLEELQQYYTVHVYYDGVTVPHAAVADADLGAFDQRLFDAHDRVWGYQAVLYMLGNGPRYHYIYDALRRRPGVVALHEPRLVSFLAGYGEARGGMLRLLEQEVARARPQLPRSDQRRLAEAAAREYWGEGPAPADLELNQGVASLARRTIVPDAGAAGRLRAALPARRDHIHAIPPGPSAARRYAAVLRETLTEPA